MPRPKRIRRVINPPHFKGFRPMGQAVNCAPVILNYEEYEAIRLNDSELLGQAEAAAVMGVSRPTYTRIYESARRKVAQAFVNGLPIIFEGGKVYFDSDWYKCNSCGCYFDHPFKDQKVKTCALCNSPDVKVYGSSLEEGQSNDMLVCASCGKKTARHKGRRCRDELCPHCNCKIDGGVSRNE